MTRDVVGPGLMTVLRGQFALDWHGIHGIGHWNRVRENGLRLAVETGADRAVVELFAVLHDARRLDDDADAGHGRRGADYAATLAGRLFHLPPESLDLLLTAIRHHSEGRTTGNVTVLTCWDADRLDFGRLGIRPHPKYLATTAARRADTIEWAWRRGLAASVERLERRD